MDREPTPIGQVIDAEMARMLGLDGWDSELVRACQRVATCASP